MTENYNQPVCIRFAHFLSEVEKHINSFFFSFLIFLVDWNNFLFPIKGFKEYKPHQFLISLYVVLKSLNQTISSDTNDNNKKYAIYRLLSIIK